MAKMNVDLLREVQAAILRWPGHFSMQWYGTGMAFNPATMQSPDCGTAACIAGWGVVLGDQRDLNDYDLDIPVRARELFRLSQKQADGLFHFCGEHDWLKDVTAQEAATAIDNFIKSNGRSCYAEEG